MSTINQFLISLSVNERNALWRGFIVVFAFLYALMTAAYARKMGESTRKSIVSASLIVATYAVVLLLAFVINLLTNAAIPVSGNVYFLPGAVACAFTLSQYLRCGFADALDIATVAFLLPRSIHLFGCSFSGCCQGYPAAWGIYSALSRTTVVPVNEIEALGIFAAWCAIHLYYRKNQYAAHGKAAAYGFVAYGTIVFVSDIFTVGVPKLLFMTSLDGLIPFITMNIGLIMLYVLDKKRTPNPRND